jgi:hypothetical protein
MLLCACSSRQGYARVGRAAADADEAGTGAAESAGDPHATPLQKDVALASHFSPPRPGSLAGLVFASQSQRPPHSAACASADRGTRDRLIVISHGPDEAEAENGVFVGCVLSRSRDI